ncbi:hypothetical protein [Halobiforma nitratireducens]|uniref:DUF7965 domain-containing protein n=1 Tax=Halobiforma nitratireducens JCM 10879 TaxID=1227454 RepID=M0LDL9_9EURY|nr:hypothetical protein [Halobiforma nitratireducens]EMA30040.1 hypothetical protein C446_16952 [Halobiforma nitratireducens JCM 10879]
MASSWRTLEVTATATSALVLVVVSAVLVGHVYGGLAEALLGTDTPTAGLLFGYLWLLALVAAADLEVVASPGGDSADARARRSVGTIGWTAGAGAGIALVYLTVVLVLGFVASGPGSTDTGTVAVGRIVVGGTVVGAGIGIVVGGLLVACDRMAAAVASDAVPSDEA